MGRIVDGVYYSSQGEPKHRGVVKVDDKLYYAQKDGKLVRNKKKTIHHGMGNGLVHHGTYYFDKDGVMDLSSFEKKKSSKKKKKSKIPTPLIAVLSCILIFGCLVIVAHYSYRDSSDLFSGPEQNNDTNTKFDLTVSVNDEEAYLCTSVMRSYYKGETTIDELVIASPAYYSPYTFKYMLSNAESAELLISENSDYSDPLTFELEGNSKDISIDNLKTGTTYYYKLTAKGANDQSREETGSFKTAATNRFVSFPDAVNTRDIGGYDTLYGKKVKQGLLIRGSELDGVVESKYYLRSTESTDPFHFVCEFDLRSPEIINTSFVSRLGEDVKHKFYNAPMYGEIFQQGNENTIKRIFADLADPDNYPMYMHCTYGADRTGTIVLLLQGVLGVSEEDMRTEYLLTGLYNKKSVEGEKIEPVFSLLNSKEGANINEKIENFLTKTIGVTKDQIEQIRSIFLEND